jgi:hypothetical protein
MSSSNTNTFIGCQNYAKAAKINCAIIRYPDKTYAVIPDVILRDVVRSTKAMVLVMYKIEVKEILVATPTDWK